MAIYTVSLDKLIRDFKRVKEFEKENWEFYEYDPLNEKIKLRKLIGKVKTTRGRIKEKYKYKILGLTKAERDFLHAVSFCYSDNPDEVNRCVENFKNMFREIF